MDLWLLAPHDPVKPTYDIDVATVLAYKFISQAQRRSSLAKLTRVLKGAALGGRGTEPERPTRTEADYVALACPGMV